MSKPDNAGLDSLAVLFEEHRERLLRLAERKLHPMLAGRLSVEDLVQDAFVAASQRLDYFTRHPEVPVYFKWRTLLLQTLADAERKHLQCQKRDAYREIRVASPSPGQTSAAENGWNGFVDSVTSPLSRLARAERYALLRKTFDALPENDRHILTLRHFDGLSNQESAAALGIAPKAASVRYTRALIRLQDKLTEFSEFKP